MPISSAGLVDLSAQETGTAWITLLTITHEGLPAPIRVTDDAVQTVSNGLTYLPYPFDVLLPDDVEGRIPQSQIRIDNTTQEIIALLRTLTTPPTLDIQVVRSATPDVVELSASGLEWRASSFDIGTITGTLTIDNLATEEWPPVTFDRARFIGLWGS